MLVLIIVIVICLALALWALEQVPLTPPFNWVIKVLFALLAILVILHLAGLG